MQKLWNEYGIVALLLIVSVGGYLSLGDQKEDFISAPLEAINARFDQLLANDTDREEFGDSFAVFEKQVREGNVPPEQIESVVATLLNMQASGAHLSTEDAQMVISLAMNPSKTVFELPGNMALASPASSEPRATSLPQPATPGSAPSPPKIMDQADTRFRDMGERMSGAFALADEMGSVSFSQREEGDSRSAVRFIVSDGIAVAVDSTVQGVWNESKLKSITRDLERKRMVRYENRRKPTDENRIARSYEKERNLYARALEQKVEMAANQERLQSLERINRLQDMGMVVNFDTTAFRIQMEESMNLLMVELKKIDFDMEFDLGDADTTSKGSEKAKKKSNN